MSSERFESGLEIALLASLHHDELLRPRAGGSLEIEHQARIVRVEEKPGRRRVLYQLANEINLHRDQRACRETHAGGISARLRQVGDQPELHRVGLDHEYQRNPCGRGLCGERGGEPESGDHGWPFRGQILRKRRQAVILIVGPDEIHHHVGTGHEPGLGHPLIERVHYVLSGFSAEQHANGGLAFLLGEAWSRER